MTVTEDDLGTVRRVLDALPSALSLARASRNESLRTAAARMNTTHVQLMRLETGATNPTLSTIYSVLDYLQEHPNGSVPRP